MSGMGGMMGRPTKQFYPSLMDMPALSPEARQFIEREAQQRVSTGVQSITAGETELHHAMAEKDPVAMQKAAAGVREGCSRPRAEQRRYAPSTRVKSRARSR
jgi:hypothetical protein